MIRLLVAGLLTFAMISAGFAQPQLESGVTIVVISDINEAYGETTYSRHVHDALNYLERLKPDLVICAGDMVAGQNLRLSAENIRAMWKGFAATILQRLGRLSVPFAFTLGNHDGPDSSKFAHERKIAEEFWEQNRPDLDYIDASCYPRFYSFVFKGIFIASIDAATSRVDLQQRDWLKRQLLSESARSSRLRVVLGHLPLYAVSQGRDNPGNVISEADSLQALLNEAGADYYISGHHHAFYLSAKGNLKMLSAGALGGGPRKLLNSDKLPVKTMTTLQLSGSDKLFKVTTHDMTNNMNVIKASDLPAELHGFNGISLLFEY